MQTGISEAAEFVMMPTGEGFSNDVPLKVVKKFKI